MSTTTPADLAPQGLLERRPTRAILADVLQLEAAKAAIEAVSTDLRGELDRRARATLEAEGVAPTWRAPGLGRAQLSDPQPKATVTDEAVFAEWAAQAHPTETTAHLSLPAEVLPAVVEALQDAQLWEAFEPPVLQTSVPWRRSLLERCERAGQDTDVVDPDTGEVIPGAEWAKAAMPRLSVVLEPAAKADAIAQAAEVGLRLLEQGLAGLAPAGSDVDAAELAMVRSVEVSRLEHPATEPLRDGEGAVVIDLDADGEPDYDERESDGFYAEDPPLSDVAAAVASEAAVQAESRAMLEGRASIDPAAASLADVDLSGLKVDALRALAGELTLSTAGRKADLVARIAAHRESLLALARQETP